MRADSAIGHNRTWVSSTNLIRTETWRLEVYVHREEGAAGPGQAKSRRTLGVAFRRHGGDTTDVVRRPSWWGEQDASGIFSV
jgi:hypothetical protein